jgi:hypothetical protein|tara:strand:- start:531 stop:1058 length:528 start_codon:yes stop_codon:yes gene_type:complete
MYFKEFPTIPYDSEGNGKFKDVKNLLRRVGVRAKIKTNTSLYDTYDVKNGESPESIAHKLYGDSELHWVILLLNNVTDRFHDWPMSEAQFIQFVNDKYDNVDAIHHYEIPQSSGDTSKKINVGTSNSDYPTATAITNFEHEQEQQDIKRKIRLLDPSFVPSFVSEFKSLMKESII